MKRTGLKNLLFLAVPNLQKKSASKWLNKNDIKNFLFFFEPYEPVSFGDNGMMFKGDVGFDITTNSLLPQIEAGKDIYLDTFGGDLYEGLKIHDAIKELKTNPHIEAMGTVASSGVQILISTENRYMSANSRLLIHNPWTVAIGDDAELKKEAGELETEKLNLAKLYSNISGKSIDEILDIMKQERFMFLEEARNLNFVKAKTVSKELETNKKDDEMENKEVEKKIGLIENMLNKVMRVLSPSQNIIVQDVNGVEIDFPELETAEQIAVGTTATIEGAPANGDYVLASGETYVFESGSLTEIKEAESEDEPEALTEEITQEIEDLKTENNILKEDIEAKKTELQNVVSNVAEIQKELNDFKNKFSSETPEINIPVIEEKKTAGKFAYNKK